MKRTLFSCLFSCMSLLASAQLNMTLLDQIDYTPNCSSLWGYIDPEDGHEYAAVGVATGLSIVSLQDPTNVVEVKFIPDVNSQWREVKSYGHYIYAVTEGGGGVLVVNMKDAPNNITSTHWAPDIPGLGTLNRIHSISVDEFGFLYLNGSNLNSGGVLIVDVTADNGNPVYVGKAPAIYCHDSYARNNILYTSDIYAGVFSVYDVSDKSNIQLLAVQSTPFLFTHNTWLNDAGTVIFTTDEKANAPVAAYDISNLGNIVELDQFRPVATVGQGSIPHNVHVWNDWVITAYYTEGTIIIDGSRPENMIEVGYFDSFVSQTAGFFGVWGVYPYFPSGLVIASDIQNGLLVYSVDYVRACWLEGKVTSATTGLPIFGANIHIESTQANAGTTNLSGEYKTGQAIPGTFNVVFSAVGYVSKTVQATLENGVLTILDVQLEPISSVAISGQTIRNADGVPVAGAKVVLQSDQITYTATTDGNGNFTLPSVLLGSYTIVGGAWGYLHEVVENFNVNLNTAPIVISLNRGYQDDFIFDLGWTATNSASTTSGFWVRGVPIGTDFNGQTSNPGADVPDDLGDQCYVTGNGGGSAGDDDVDGGVVTLHSPVMDLSNYNEPVLKYRTWFFNAGGNGTPNDALQVRISNGTEEVILETITQSLSQWRPESAISLNGLIPLTNNMRIIFETSDLPSSGHLVEAAVDAFFVEEVSAYPPFAASAVSGCSPFTINFSDSSDSTATWVWTFEGGTPATSSEQNPAVTYNAPGIYDVTLTVVTNQGNTYTIERPNFITVGLAPAANFNADVAGEFVTFTNQTAGTASYSWNFGDGTTSTAANPSHAYQQTGTFTVTLTATNACGTSSFSQNIEILYIPPVSGFAISSATGCVPMTIQFSDTSTGDPTSWAWVFPGGEPSSSNEQNPVVIYNAPGTYSVQLTTSNPAGISELTLPQVIEVGELPSATFTYEINDYTVLFFNASMSGMSFEWSFGDGTSSTEANPTHTYSGPGFYVVTLTTFNNCGIAVSTQTVEVQVSSVLNPDETGISLTAAPNPFSGQVLVKYELSGNFKEANLLVFNVLGREIDNIRISASGSGSILLGERISQSGVYFVRLVVDGKMGEALRLVRM